MKHNLSHTVMVNLVKTGCDVGNLEQVREAFPGVSDSLIKAVENQEYENQRYEKQELYLQFCPMARGGDGASWISQIKEIEKPYMGQKMLRCGETKNQINLNS